MLERCHDFRQDLLNFRKHLFKHHRNLHSGEFQPPRSTDLHAECFCLQLGQVVGVVLQLPPQVGVLLPEYLHLVGQLVVRSHRVGHFHALQRPLQEETKEDAGLRKS